jgi:hypothetical protein
MGKGKRYCKVKGILKQTPVQDDIFRAIACQRQQEMAMVDLDTEG